MNRRSFFASLLATVVARWFPKPAPREEILNPCPIFGDGLPWSLSDPDSWTPPRYIEIAFIPTGVDPSTVECTDGTRLAGAPAPNGRKVYRSVG